MVMRSSIVAWRAEPETLLHLITRIDDKCGEEYMSDVLILDREDESSYIIHLMDKLGCVEINFHTDTFAKPPVMQHAADDDPVTLKRIVYK